MWQVLVQNNLGPQDQGCKEVESGVLKPNQFRAPNSTNLHVHGIYASMKEDNVLACIDRKFMRERICERRVARAIMGLKSTQNAANTSLKYNYTIHPDSGSELLWYHPHFDGSSFLQLTNGMAGAFEVVDPEQEAKLELGGPGELLLVQMANLLPDHNSSDSIFYANTQTGSTMPLNLSFTHEDGSKPKFKGTLLFVNGDLQPTMSIGTGRWQRLKIINAMGGVTNAMTFHIVGAGKNDSNVSNTTSSRCEMAVLAYDGIFLSGSPRKQSSVFLPPGGRAEVAVRCLTPGAYNLQTRDVFTKEGDPTSTLGQSLASGHILLTMNVAEGNGSSTNTSSKLSDTLPGPPSFYSDLMPLKRDEIDGMHSIELSNFNGDVSSEANSASYYTSFATHEKGLCDYRWSSTVSPSIIQ